MASVLEEGRYSRVSRRVWGDERFHALSAPKPNAQTLWFRLLTGPELGAVPGLFAAREAGLADALRWPLAAFRRCFGEIEAQRMAEADWRAGLVWVPKGLAHNPPANPNVVKGWRGPVRELPECALKLKALKQLEQALRSTYGPQWADALAEALAPPKLHGRDPERVPVNGSRNGSAKGVEKGRRKQDHDQDHDQDLKQDQDLSREADQNLNGNRARDARSKTPRRVLLPAAQELRARAEALLHVFERVVHAGARVGDEDDALRLLGGLVPALDDRVEAPDNAEALFERVLEQYTAHKQARGKTPTVRWFVHDFAQWAETTATPAPTRVERVEQLERELADARAARSAATSDDERTSADVRASAAERELVSLGITP